MKPILRYLLGIASNAERFSLQTHHEAMYGMQPGHELNRLREEANRLEKRIERLDRWRMELQS